MIELHEIILIIFIVYNKNKIPMYEKNALPQIYVHKTTSSSIINHLK